VVVVVHRGQESASEQQPQKQPLSRFSANATHRPRLLVTWISQLHYRLEQSFFLAGKYEK
jgi:hypothetical protein